jgi:hypothetical protein
MIGCGRFGTLGTFPCARADEAPVTINIALTRVVTACCCFNVLTSPSILRYRILAAFFGYTLTLRAARSREFRRRTGCVLLCRTPGYKSHHDAPQRRPPSEESTLRTKAPIRTPATKPFNAGPTMIANGPGFTPGVHCTATQSKVPSIAPNSRSRKLLFEVRSPDDRFSLTYYPFLRIPLRSSERRDRKLREKTIRSVGKSPQAMANINGNRPGSTAW